MIQFYRNLLIISIVLLLGISGCGATAARELAPGGDIVKKAISLQLSFMSKSVTEQLDAANPNLLISQIAVKQLNPLVVGSLPTYHLLGTYRLAIKLPNQTKIQNDNKFDIYIQRQAEGKTWRLLKKDSNNFDRPVQWQSYLIR